MTNAVYSDGQEAKDGDLVKFLHDGEVHFGKIVSINEDGTAELTHVRHMPMAVEHHIDLNAATLAHRY